MIIFPKISDSPFSLSSANCSKNPEFLLIDEVQCSYVTNQSLMKFEMQ